MQKFYEILPENKNTSVALGFFDGIHSGHRKVIENTVAASNEGLVPVCFTFSQNPKAVLSKGECKAVMTTDDKYNTLKELGIEHIYCIDFKSIMDMNAEDFVNDILFGKLKAKKLFCGFNYRFGKNGEGDVLLLEKLCKKNNATLTIMPPDTENGEVVSSTLIRTLIKNGNVKRANKLLCGRFGFTAEIQHGKKLGRMLGTPTINQPLCKELVVPAYGVYASAITLENGEVYAGVTNIGIKPTVGGTTPVCETWMPEYSGGEIYGCKADIRLLDFIRAEKKFCDLDELKTAIEANGKTALEIFKTMQV